MKYRTKTGRNAAAYQKRSSEQRTAILQQQMRQAAAELDFETAAKLRDELFSLTGESVGVAKPAPGTIGSARRSKGRGRKSPKRK